MFLNIKLSTFPECSTWWLVPAAGVETRDAGMTVEAKAVVQPDLGRSRGTLEGNAVEPAGPQLHEIRRAHNKKL